MYMYVYLMKYLTHHLYLFLPLSLPLSPSFTTSSQRSPAERQHQTQLKAWAKDAIKLEAAINDLAVRASRANLQPVLSNDQRGEHDAIHVNMLLCCEYYIRPSIFIE